MPRGEAVTSTQGHNLPKVTPKGTCYDMNIVASSPPLLPAARARQGQSRKPEGREPRSGVRGLSPRVRERGEEWPAQAPDPVDPQHLLRCLGSFTLA